MSDPFAPTSSLRARRQAVAMQPTAESIANIVYSVKDPSGVCWKALTDGLCPFGHEWVAVSSDLDTVELPVITYGGPGHWDISHRAYTAFRQACEVCLTPVGEYGHDTPAGGRVHGSCLIESTREAFGFDEEDMLDYGYFDEDLA